jgi:hypothetical protein
MNPIWSESEEELTNSHFEDLSTVLQSGTNLYFNELYFSKVWVFLFVFLFFNKVCGLRPRTTTMHCNLWVLSPETSYFNLHCRLILPGDCYHREHIDFRVKIHNRNELFA